MASIPSAALKTELITFEDCRKMVLGSVAALKKTLFDERSDLAMSLFSREKLKSGSSRLPSSGAQTG